MFEELKSNNGGGEEDPPLQHCHGHCYVFLSKPICNVLKQTNLGLEISSPFSFWVLSLEIYKPWLDGLRQKLEFGGFAKNYLGICQFGGAASNWAKGAEAWTHGSASDYSSGQWFGAGTKIFILNWLMLLNLGWAHKDIRIWVALESDS
ncbi:unnamed protein product [Prunus armeniaca]|uniref:Uncharacterized protein n=1 Tax=Prunus armeniaca TaxID=36596 RepID=A0A6J5TH27_PRUAR|nr:unnamed protein product [Prunus armeniaca]